MALSQFTDTDIIASRLSKLFKTKEFDPYIIGELCAQFEVEMIHDTDIMWEYRAIPLTVGPELMVLLPCNLYKIIELYNKNEEFLEYNKTQTHLMDIRNPLDPEKELEEGDVIYISFKGIPVNLDTGNILIPSGHEQGCETYCKVKLFEEDVLLGHADKQMWMMWDHKLSGQIQSIQGSYRNVDKGKLFKFQVVNANMLPKIGRMIIENRQFY